MVKLEIRILLVEDEPLIREIMAEVLEDEGYLVTATCTGDEAAILLAEDRFALLLTDVTMPGTIDGIDLAEHARQVHPGLPVVFVSGRPESEVRARRLPNPVAFFAKPYEIEILLRAVAQFATP